MSEPKECGNCIKWRPLEDRSDVGRCALGITQPLSGCSECNCKEDIFGCILHSPKPVDPFAGWYDKTMPELQCRLRHQEAQGVRLAYTKYLELKKAGKI